MVILRAAAACFIWMGLAGSAFAGGLTTDDAGTVRVRVSATVASGAAAIAVSIHAEHDPASRRTSSIAAGSHITSFSGLTPGTYVVSVGGPPTPATTLTITLLSREILTVLAPPAPGQTLTIADRQHVGEGADFDERWLQDLPAGGNVWSLIETAVPFVIADRMDNGGLGTGRSAWLGSRGASWTTTAVTLGDVRVLAPNLFGLIPFSLDLNAIDTVTVTSGLAEIEAESPGVLIGLTPRRAGGTRRGAVQGSFTEPGMVDLNPLPGAPSIGRLASWRELGAQFGGPVGDRARLIVSGAFSRALHHERDRPGLWTSQSGSLFSHLVKKRDDGNQIRVVAAAQRVRSPYDGRRQFRDTNVYERGAFIQSSAAWERVGPTGNRAGVSLAFQRSAFTPDVANNVEGGTVDRVTEGTVPRPAADMVSSQWEAAAHVALRLLSWRSMAHELRAGITARRAAASSDMLSLPVVAEQVGGIAARVWLPSSPTSASRRSLLHGSAYMADRIALGASFTMDAGVRVDLTRGSARGATNGINWRTVSPRFSFQWSRGPIAIFGGAGRYADPLTLSLLAYGDPGETVSNVHRWFDLDGDRKFDTGELGVVVSRAGWGSSVATIDPDLRASRMTERTIGIEMRHRQVFVWRAAAIWRNQSAIHGSINTGVPASSYRVVFIPDAAEDWDGPGDDKPLAVFDRLPESFGKDAFLLTNPADGNAKYEGIETTWTLSTRRLRVLFGVMAYRTRSWVGHLGFGPLENDQSVVGDVFEQPNARPVVQGSYFFDRSYVAKWSTSYRAPGDIRVGFSARYQDGQPFSRVVIAPNLASGAQMIHAYRIGRTRFTYTLTLDIRVEKGFTIAGRRSALQLDVFNATRHRNEVEEDVLTTPNFRRSTAVQPPLTFRVGFRIGI